jgi:SHS2 domain-containing protein
MQGRGHRSFEHTADLGIEAWGPDLTSLFEEVITGLCEIIADTSTIEASDQREASAEGFDQEELLVSLSNEVLFFLDSQSFLSKNMKVSSLEQDGEVWRAKGILHGELYERDKHTTFTEIKSATYHDLKIQASDGGLVVKIVFDV